MTFHKVPHSALLCNCHLLWLAVIGSLYSRFRFLVMVVATLPELGLLNGSLDDGSENDSADNDDFDSWP